MRQQSEEWTRLVNQRSVLPAARQVQALRNRIAHHEHIVWGVPFPGMTHTDDTTERLSVSQAQHSA